MYQKEEYIKLVEDLNKFNDYYYNKGQSLVTDYEYDMMYNKLLDIEESNPDWVLEDSPSQKVGSPISVQSKNKVKHSYPMLSLRNTYNIKEVSTFIGNLVDAKVSKIRIEPKLDGCSLSIIYKNGKLFKAVTRGDGVVGEDITRNAYAILNIPEVLNKKIDIEIRGEVLMRNSTFAKILEMEEVEYANPRNLVAGTLRLLNPENVGKRKLEFFAYDCSYELDFDEKSRFINSLGFPPLFLSAEFDIALAHAIDRKCAVQLVTQTINRAIENTEHLLRTEYKDFPTDGLVIKSNNYEINKKMGSTSKYPRWAVAYKFSPEEVWTKLLSIDYQVGRSGKVTPVANFEPVKLAGTIVRRATLHNFDEMHRLQIKNNCEVQVVKAAEIIPKIIGVRGGDELINPPKVCPTCGDTLEKEDGGVDYYCMNLVCRGSELHSLVYFASKNCMDITGLGQSIIEKLYDNKIVTTPSDFYKLKYNINKLIDIVGERISEKILNSIEVSKLRDYKYKIAALGIPGVGLSVARDIAMEIDSRLLTLTHKKLEALPLSSINQKTRDNLVKWINNPCNIKLINELEELGVKYEPDAIIKKPSSLKNNEFSNKKFCITGSFEKYTREEIKDIIETVFGGKVSSSISSNTNYLIAGSGTENGSKLTAAKNNPNIKIIYENDLDRYL